LIALNGEKLTDAERVVFTKLTGREREPLQRCEEFWGVIGRRGGKSQAIAVLVVYLALLVTLRRDLPRDACRGRGRERPYSWRPGGAYNK
jgi:hypothetical protein